MLLRDAVDAATAGEEGARVDRHDVTPRVGAPQDLQRLLVGGIVEGARDDRSVEDVVVDVAVVDEPVGIARCLGSGQLEDGQPSPVRVGFGGELPDEMVGDWVIRVVGVWLTVDEDRPGGGEGGHQVDVPARAVAVAVAGEPPWQLSLIHI